MPASEQRLGRNLIHSYLRSLSLSVEKPQEVTDTELNENGDAEYYFMRKGMEGKEQKHETFAQLL